MRRYATSQRKILIDFLEKNRHSKFSAREIYENLKHKNISLSAVYRNLPLLEKDGYINRVATGDGKQVFYQSIELAGCGKSLHMFCNKCGKTFHMDDDIANNFFGEIKNKNNFSVDVRKTIVYGICDECK